MTNPIQFPDPSRGLRPIEPLKSIEESARAEQSGKVQQEPGKDFKSILVNSLNEVNRLQTEADEGVQKLITGESNNVAEVLAAADKAGIAFDLLMEVRNKLTDAYQEIQQMRV